MMKVKYIRHPIHTLKAAKSLAKAHLTVAKLASTGRLKYKDDPRYDLKNVTDGFASSLDTRGDDSELLERICRAYIKTIQSQPPASEAYAATNWWEEIRQRSLQPVIRALLSSDVKTLQGMYRNFFRDPCSTGLLNVPFGMSKAYFGRTIKDVHRRFYLSESLHKLDYWSLKTQGRFSISDLSSPKVGNPFGIYLDSVLIRAGAPYHHYCAHMIDSVLPSSDPVVAEIGGGFGGTAYYLLRNCAKMTYLNFDVPESLALSSYYLLKTFPKLQFHLFGEPDAPNAVSDRAKAFLMPLWKLSTFPPASFDIVFSSHSISDLSHKVLRHYLRIISRVTRDHFLYIGNSPAADVIGKTIRQDHPSAVLVQRSSSGWSGHNHPSGRADEQECLYRFHMEDLDRRVVSGKTDQPSEMLK